jgi:tRNA dimethylallyltransferase
MDKNPLLIILGPTASGKTRLAVHTCLQLNGEIISADSRQVFTGMDIGTGKDLNEYTVDSQTVPYHLINIMEAGEQYNVNAFKEDFYAVFEKLTAAKKLPVICGGTGMYIHSLLQNQQYTAVPVNQAFRDSLPAYDIEQLRSLLGRYPSKNTAHADLTSAKRLVRAIEIAEYLQDHTLEEEAYPVLNPLIIGLTGSVEKRRDRILKRLTARFNEGLIDEIEGLLSRGVRPEMLLFYGLEYKFVTAYLQNEMSFPELQEKLYISICQFAKRQMTFFRKMEKDGVVINWMDADQPAEVLRKEVIKSYQAKYFI